MGEEEDGRGSGAGERAAERLSATGGSILGGRGVAMAAAAAAAAAASG